MRVFQTNEEGLDVQVGQKPVRFKGHVVIAPQVDRRRIAVLTNLGEMAILEVDSFNPKDKVFKQVNSVENQQTPKLAWPLMVENDLLIASTRLALYQIQESSQKLNQQWSKDDLDQFTSRPVKADDFVIHTRVVRGNLGVRATAIKMGTGDVVWESDLGVPVSSLSTDGKGFLAITAQGAAFSIEGKSFQSKQPVAPVENLGRNQRSMMFVSPIKRPDSSIVIMNQALGNQLLVVDPTRRATNPTKMLPLDFADAFPASEPVSLGNGSILVPLTNGQIAMIDPEKGKLVGLPFQPIVQAGERPKWLNPSVLADKQTAIVADQQRFMYKLATGKQLRSITSQPLEKPLKGRLSILKDVIVGVSAGVSGDQLDFYDSSELKRFTSLPVEGRFVWGPYAVEGDSTGVLLALSDIDGLVACDETGKLLWSKPLGKIVLIGTPNLIESDCIVASTSGELIRVSLSTGNIVARVQIGEPISGPPLVLPKVMLVPCDEGIVVTVPLLTATSENAGESR
jgi:outer membrane protein assembly factor BamB